MSSIAAGKPPGTFMVAIAGTRQFESDAMVSARMETAKA
jgi:hypothetical protein